MLNLTLEETIHALNNGQVLPTSHVLSVLESLLDEKEQLEEEATLATECKEVLFSIIDSKITDIVNSQVEYNENYTDSHGNYAELVADNYVYCNRQDELVEFCNDNNIDLSNVNIETLENELFDIMKGEAVHQFCGRPYFDKFLLACFAFGEHEIRVDFDQIGDHITYEIMQYMKSNNLFSEHCGSLGEDSALFYQPSDNVLEFSVTIEQIKNTVKNLSE